MNVNINQPALVTTPKVAVVHEWFDGYAGSERCVEQFLQLYPEAGLFAIVDFLDDRHRHILHGRRAECSFLQRFPWARTRFRSFLPLMPLAVEQFDVSPYDVVISSNHAVAKGVVTRGDQLHISYVHTPIRYAWDMQHEYLREGGLSRGIRSWLARLALHYLRLWDRAAADRVDVFVANSYFVARRIRKTYRRPAHVIYPPVDVQQFSLSHDRDDYYVTASRLVPYKKVDILVEAFRLLPEKKLVVIGDGPEMARLQKKSPPNVEWAGFVNEQQLNEKVGHAKAFLFAAEEDFGIAPVEAQACGTPVIALGRGGALETVVDGQTGLFFPEQTAEAVADCVRRFEKSEHLFEPELIREHALRFSEARFRTEFKQLLDEEWDSFQRAGQPAWAPHGGLKTGLDVPIRPIPR